jgi:two-component system, cell cycle response regulator DivK
MAKKRVLLIEDNIDNFELVRYLLERAGYEVLAGYNGQEGMEIAHRELPDLILMDLSLPIVDGWTAARTLKADPVTTNIPLLALTAHTLPGDRKRAIEAGFDGYISKPIDVVRFSENIDKVILTKQEKT